MAGNGLLSSARAAVTTIQPSTSNEIVLLALVQELEAQLKHTEGHAIELQAANVLNEAYAARMKTQLAKKETKKEMKKSSKLIVGDGKPRLLTCDTFYELVQDKAREKRKLDQEKLDRQEAQKLFKVAKDEWEVADGKRKVAAAKARALNKKATDAFKDKKTIAAKKGQKIQKPPAIPVPKAIPKPKLMDFLKVVGVDAVSDSQEHDGTGSREEFDRVTSDSGSSSGEGDDEE